MNKQEKIIAALLGLALVGWLWYTTSEQKKAAEAAQAARLAQMAEQSSAESDGNAATNGAPAAVASGATTDVGRVTSPLAAAESNRVQSAAAPEVKAPAPSTPEKIVVLENDQISISLSSHGASVKSATLKKYAEKPGPISDENPAVKLDFSSSPALSIEGGGNLPQLVDFTVAESGLHFS